MKTISRFPRWIVLARAGNRGQAAALFLVTAVVLLSLVFSAVYLSHQGVLKTASADRIDSLAISAATWEARGLNLIAALNDGVLQCFRLIRWICAVWAALAVLAATGYGAAIFSAYSNYARRFVRNLWERARDLAGWADKVREATPGLVLAETASLAEKLKVVGALSPCNPEGTHDAEGTLELHLKQGEPMGLADAMLPILTALGSGLGKAVRAILNPIVEGLLGASGEPIRLLVPEDDFDKAQSVRFTGFAEEEGLSLPFVPPAGRRRYVFSSFACPYGGGSTSMTWKSRLFEKEDR
jgi:hypothetical protein